MASANNPTQAQPEATQQDWSQLRKFFRTVPLPQKVNLEKLTAKMQDGVLQITIPLDESARPRRVQIES